MLPSRTSSGIYGLGGDAALSQLCVAIDHNRALLSFFQLSCPTDFQFLFISHRKGRSRRKSELTSATIF